MPTRSAERQSTEVAQTRFSWQEIHIGAFISERYVGLAPVLQPARELVMNRSRIGLLLLAVVALAALAAGASGGWAATRALSRAVADTGQSVEAMETEAQLPPLPSTLYDRWSK